MVRSKQSFPELSELRSSLNNQANASISDTRSTVLSVEDPYSQNRAPPACPSSAPRLVEFDQYEALSSSETPSSWSIVDFRAVFPPLLVFKDFANVKFAYLSAPLDCRRSPPGHPFALVSAEGQRVWITMAAAMQSGILARIKKESDSRGVIGSQCDHVIIPAKLIDAATLKLVVNWCERRANPFVSPEPWQQRKIKRALDGFKRTQTQHPQPRSVEDFNARAVVVVGENASAFLNEEGPRELNDRSYQNQAVDHLTSKTEAGTMCISRDESIFPTRDNIVEDCIDQNRIRKKEMEAEAVICGTHWMELPKLALAAHYLDIPDLMRLIEHRVSLSHVAWDLLMPRQ